MYECGILPGESEDPPSYCIPYPMKEKEIGVWAT
nr:MAG TPA: hypothetical protein [Caudoviricetes sp.]